MVSTKFMAGSVAKMIQLMTSSSFESVIRFFGIFLLVKALPLDAFGEYSIIVAFAAITATIVNFGGYNLIMSSEKSVNVIYLYEIAVTTLNTLILPFLLFAFSFIYDLTLLIICIFFSEHFLVSIQAITYASLLKEKKELLLSLIRTIVALLFLLVCILLTYFEFSERIFIILYILYSFLTCLIYIASVIYSSKKEVKFLFPCIKHYHLRLKDGVWFLASGLARSAFFNLDKIIVGYFFSKEITAIYAIVMRINNALFSIVNAALATTESAYYVLRDSDLAKHYKRTIKYSFFISFIMSTLGFAAIPFVLKLFPNDYYVITDYLYLMPIILVLQSVSWNNLNYLNGIRKEKIRLFCMLWGVVILFILNLASFLLSLKLFPLYIYMVSILFIFIYSFVKVRNESRKSLFKI